MRTLRKFTLLGITALLIVGMSSCLKTEQEFGIGVYEAYITQINNGSGETMTSRFVPFIRIVGNEPIAEATAKEGLNTYTFTFVANTQNTYMDIDLGYMYDSDSIPANPFAITAKNAEGTLASTGLSFKDLKKLGAFEVTELKYSVGNGITATWTKSENATGYCVAVKPIDMDGAKWVYMDWSDHTSSTATSGTFRNDVFEKDKQYDIAVVALYNGALRLKADKMIRITGGTDYTE